VQDLGRPGFGVRGISPSGAADPVALQLGNLLVGNTPGTAALEMTLMGGKFVFSEPTAIALAGSDFATTLNEHALDTWRSYSVAAGEQLRAGPTRDGARCYLCVAGGIQVEPFLGSASTHLVSGLGGFAGRGLRKGDVVTILDATTKFVERTLSSAALQILQPRKAVLRVTDGPQCDLFSAEMVRSLYESEFRVTEESNRLGLRLEGATLKSTLQEEMITEGVTLGAIQITPSGQPIVLFVEQQTTGGYPKIANVISADLFRIGQLRPRDNIRFERVSFAQARAAWLELQQLLTSRDTLFA
jgi:antagonist of KipI